jgi:CubicO group peptidase (beta-lactamase class C family)
VHAEGSTTAEFAAVRDAFEAVLDEHEAAGATGTAVAVHHRGEWVVDLWGGHADAARTKPWAADTLVMPYSVTKPFAAVCALVLVDRGVLDLDAPLTTYWPEMVAATTLRQVLSHQSGHALLERPAPPEALLDWDRMCTLIAAQPPLWEPGHGCGESALLYGHLVGEVVRRVDGRSLGTFLREEVCDPHGIDFHVGLREGDLPRVADLTGLDTRRTSDPAGVMERAVSNPPGARDPDVVNSTAWRVAEVPAVNGHGTARAVAGLLVALAEGRLLSEPLAREMARPAVTALDYVLGEQATWGLGVGIDDDGIGMGGLGGSLAWHSTEGDYVLGFVTGLVAEHDRVTRVDNAVRACLGLPPL